MAMNWLLMILVVLGVLTILLGLFVATVVIRLVRARTYQEPQPIGRRTTPATGGRDWVALPVGNRQASVAVRTCPECGAALTSDCPEGLCPKCLLRFGLPESEVQPGEARQVRTTPHEGLFTPPTPADLAPLFPQLEILELIGQGGMGAVYKARQTKLDRLVALKILPPDAGRDPAFSERFGREARAMGHLSHSHIVAAHDFGEVNGLFYILMEYVDGVNLRQALAAGPLEPRQVLILVSQICSALQYAHEEGVVHRDIKPENILLDKRGHAKIADFGLAKLLGRAPAGLSLTGSQQVMGTYHYLAPEQMERPQEVDHRADVYSLGVVFYEMLTGELPLGRFPPPSHKAGVDARLDAIVLRALEKDPAQRFQHASEVRSEVEAISADRLAVPIVNDSGLEPVGTALEMVSFQVKGPAAAVIAAGMLGCIFWVFGGAALLWKRGASQEEMMQYDLYLPLGALVLCAVMGIIVLGAIKMARLRAYELAALAAILVMLPWSPHFLIGLPIGAHALWVLSKPKVKAAFARNLRGASYGQASIGPVRRKARGFLGSFLTWFFSSPHEETPPEEGLESSLAPIPASESRVSASRFQHAGEGRSEVESVVRDVALSPAVGAAEKEALLEAARWQVRGPAVGLLVTAGVNWVGVLIFVLVWISQPPAFDKPAPHQVAGVGLPIILGSCVLFFGALKMVRLESRRWALAAAALALLVGPAYPLGWPVGLWAFAVLTRREVKAAFPQTTTRRDWPGQGSLRRSTVLGAVLLSAAIVLCAFTPWRAFRLTGFVGDEVFVGTGDGTGAYLQVRPFESYGFQSWQSLAAAGVAACLAYVLLATGALGSGKRWHGWTMIAAGAAVALLAGISLADRSLPVADDWTIWDTGSRFAGAPIKNAAPAKWVEDARLRQQTAEQYGYALRASPQYGVYVTLALGVGLLLLGAPSLRGSGEKFDPNIFAPRASITMRTDE